MKITKNIQPHIGAPISTPENFFDQATADLNNLAQLCWAVADKNGWHDEPRDFGTVLMLVVTEVAEAMEAWREGGDPAMDRTTAGKPEGVPSELADVLIRVLHICAIYKIDITKAVRTKMLFNSNRPYRHGGKLA